MPDGLPGQVLGLLGGTFDPVHRGHLALAEAAFGSGSINRLRWIPAGHPPHRAPPIAAALHRLTMVRLALGELPSALANRCEIDPGEVENIAPSYTINTLERLRRELGPTQSLALILGADAFLGLPNWHRWSEILTHAHLLMTERPGHKLDLQHMPEALRSLMAKRYRDDPATLSSLPAGLIHSFAMPATDISATDIRAQLVAGHFDLASGAPVDLLPVDVVGYIRQHHLYQNANEAHEANEFTETASPRC